MHRIAFHSRLDLPWTGMEPVRLGRAPNPSRPADRFVTVESEGRPLLRVDLYRSSGECFAFEAACAWSDFVGIGWGHQLYLVQPHARQVWAFDLGSYFGHLFQGEKYLLVASAERVFCIAPDGSLRWQSELLGIDGVTIDRVDNEVVHGQGEWDPPGGWQPFSVSLHTGQPVSRPK